MRPLTSSEKRLLWIFGAVGFLLINYWGYNELALRRTQAEARQRLLQAEIFRLRQLQLEKPMAEVNRQWLASRLPAYRDVDQLETHLYSFIRNTAEKQSIDLTKLEPRPTQKDELVHRSIVDIDFTDEIEQVINFLHAVQDQDAFRFIQHLELLAGKDPQKIRCQARIEQWWRPDSDAVAAALPQLPSSSATEAPAAAPDPPSIEQEEDDAVQTASTQPSAAPQ